MRGCKMTALSDKSAEVIARKRGSDWKNSMLTAGAHAMNLVCLCVTNTLFQSSNSKLLGD